MTRTTNESYSTIINILRFTCNDSLIHESWGFEIDSDSLKRLLND
jgi:hypothetical protein